MKHYQFIAAAMTLTALPAACSDKEHEPYSADERTALSIHADIWQSADAATRTGSHTDAATRAGDSDWQPNDAIGIIMLDAGTATGNGTFAPDGKEQTAYFPTNGALVDILAYYPYTTAVNAGNLRLAVDVSRQDNLPAIDLTGAKATLTGTTLTGEWDLTTGKLTPKGEAKAPHSAHDR